GIAEKEAIAAREAEAKELVARQKADDARKRADRGYRFSVDLMERLGDTLQVVEGALPARKLLVSHISGFLEVELDGTAPDNPLFGNIADGYLRLGSIVGGVRNPNEGEVTEAIRLYRIALDLRDRQVEAVPDSANANRGKALAHAYIGDLLIRTGEVARARAEYQQFLEISRSLVARDPGSQSLRRSLAIALVEMGDAHLEMGLRDEGTPLYEESMRIREQLAREEYDDARYARRAQRDLTVGIQRLADERSVRGDHDGALAKFRQALDIRRTLLDAAPSSSRALRDLAVTDIFVARELLALDRADEALPHAEEAGRLARRRLVDNPTDERARTVEAMQLEVMGRVQGALGAWDEAQRLHEKALGRVEELARTQPALSLHRERQARLQLRLGETSAARGDAGAAVRHGREAMAIARRLSDEDRRNVEAEIFLAWSLRDLGHWLVEAGNEREAARHLNEARELYQRLVDGQPMLEELQQGLKITSDTLRDLGG
ncbi:MAG: tetratricopeptide repeat protein, partial [Planctomycetota bacterium]